MPPRSLSVACALACASLLVLSCSSAPKKSDTVVTVKTQADQQAVWGEAYFRQGRYDLALQFFTQALSEYSSVDDGEGIIRSYNAIGKCSVALGSLDRAENIFLKARERAQGGNLSLLFDSSVNLAELYLAKGDGQAARTMLQETDRMLFPGRRPSQTATLYHDLGTAEKILGNSARALECFELSLKTNLANKYFAEAASDYYMIASVHSRDGRYEEALRNASLALSYDKRVESSPGIAKDLYALGLIAAKKGDQGSAFDFFQRSYLVSTTLGFRDDMKKALAGLVAAADALGRTADAEAYRKALVDLQSSPPATGSS
ncbi:MAG: tetratricopeptide repeat protein [Spirochaetia bacterium]|jgi:tetratricopeptide (TPR) repeat protein